MLLLLIQKWLHRKNKAEEMELESIRSELVRIQAGDEDLRNDLLRRYQPYVAKTAARFCKRYIHPETDDEFSIALTAFNEAISSYDTQAERSFLSFAETVIRRRLTDYVRKEQRHHSSIPQSAFLTEDEEGETYDPTDAGASVEQYQKDQENAERKLEIETLNRELSDFGITFADLVEGSPKHEDTRQSFMAIGALISRVPELSEALITKKSLPLKLLADQVSVSRKTLERGRKYIIAVALIHMGSYPHLQSYVSPSVPFAADMGVQNREDALKG